MIAWLIIIAMSTMLGASITCMLLRMRAVQEFSYYLGRVTKYRACAEGVCSVALRIYYQDRSLQHIVQERRSCVRRIDIPGEQWWGMVSYELAHDDMLHMEITLISSLSERPLLCIHRVVEPLLFEYNNNDADAPSL